MSLNVAARLLALAAVAVCACSAASIRSASITDELVEEHDEIVGNGLAGGLSAEQLKAQLDPLRAQYGIEPVQVADLEAVAKLHALTTSEVDCSLDGLAAFNEQLKAAEGSDDELIVDIKEALLDGYGIVDNKLSMCFFEFDEIVRTALGAYEPDSQARAEQLAARADEVVEALNASLGGALPDLLAGSGIQFGSLTVENAIKAAQRSGVAADACTADLNGEHLAEVYASVDNILGSHAWPQLAEGSEAVSAFVGKLDAHGLNAVKFYLLKAVCA